MKYVKFPYISDEINCYIIGKEIQEHNFYVYTSKGFNDFITNNKIKTIMQLAFYSMNNDDIEIKLHKEIESIIRMVRK